jgi:hypothetical protein
MKPVIKHRNKERQRNLSERKTMVVYIKICSRHTRFLDFVHRLVQCSATFFHPRHTDTWQYATKFRLTKRDYETIHGHFIYLHINPCPVSV